jgi:hypothetical protein
VDVYSVDSDLSADDRNVKSNLSLSKTEAINIES